VIELVAVLAAATFYILQVGPINVSGPG